MFDTCPRTRLHTHGAQCASGLPPIHVVVNGTDCDVNAPATISSVAALVSVQASDGGVAAALDGVVVPNDSWAAVAVHDGARVEIVRAAAGG